MRIAALAFLACGLGLGVACGGAEDSPLFDGGAGGDGGGDGSTTTDAGCDNAKCPTVPQGFALVRVAQSQGACPSGWDATDAVTSPTAAADACSCDCNVTQQPSCEDGTITRGFDDSTTPTCTTAGATLPANQGACSQTGQALFLSHQHYQVNPPPATGGACTYAAKADPGKLDAAHLTVCAPPTGCAAAACEGNVCIMQSGDVDCPAEFAHKTLAGASVSATCSDCGACTVTGACTGTMKFFTDTQCAAGETDFAADGVCEAQSGSATSYYYSYEYQASVQAATCGAATSTATPSLEKPDTICCQQ